MPTVIPREIEDEEILIRYIFDRNFKRKRIEAEKLVEKDVFIPNTGGVSLQRNRYVNETSCKKIAKRIPDRKYVGFMVFKKATFLQEKKAYIQNSRRDFEADIVASPLNEESGKVPQEKRVYTDDLGQPAHADLIYINPAPQSDETPKTAIRSFSRKLAKQTKLILDEDAEQKEYIGKAVKDAFVEGS